MPKDSYWFDKIDHNEWLSPDKRFKLKRSWSQEQEKFLYHIHDKDKNEEDVYQVGSLEAASKFCRDYLEGEKHSNSKDRKRKKLETSDNPTPTQPTEIQVNHNNAQKVLAVCMQLADGDGLFQASYRQIADEAKASYAHTTRIMKRFVDAGWIVIIDPGGKKSSTKWGFDDAVLSYEQAIEFLKTDDPQFPEAKHREDQDHNIKELGPDNSAPIDPDCTGDPRHLDVDNNPGILAARANIRVTGLEERVEFMLKNIIERVEKLEDSFEKFESLLNTTVSRVTSMSSQLLEIDKRAVADISVPEELRVALHNTAGFMKANFGVDILKKKGGN